MAKVLHFQSILERSNEPESCFYLALRMCTYVKKTLENSLYRTPNQRKPAIFTKHSNGNINISCCGSIEHFPEQALDGWSSSFKTIVSLVTEKSIFV